MELQNKKCVPCEIGTPPLTSEQIKALRPEISSEWQLLDDKKIERQFTFNDFVAAMKFVNEVATLAESEGHHPDIAIHYNKVVVTLWTHASNGLSENDFIVAKKIDVLER